MPKSLFALFTALLVASGAFAQSIENGDFSKGMVGWKGDRKIVEEPGDSTNKVLEVELSKTRSVIFRQLIDTRNLDRLKISFRYKTSADYSSSGFTLRFTRPDRSFTFYEYDLIAPIKWRSDYCDFTEIKGANKIDFAIEVSKGTGKIYFDDFVITR